MTLNKPALRKAIFLLMCTALMVTCIGSAAALDSQEPSYSTSTTQSQSGIVTNGAISSSESQSAESSTTGVGGVEINQAQDLNLNILQVNGEVKSTTLTMNQDQTVNTANTGGDTSSTNTYSNYNTDPTLTGPGPIITSSQGNAGIVNNYVYAGSTRTSPTISFSQMQTGESTGDISQSQSASVKVIHQNNKYQVIEHYMQRGS